MIVHLKNLTIKLIFCLLLFFIANSTFAQDTIVIGFGGEEQVAISSSDPASNPEKTLDQSGFLPNDQAAARFLDQTTVGFNIQDIDLVKQIGKEDWLESQLSMPLPPSIVQRIRDYFQFVEDRTGDVENAHTYLFWEYAWWQYHMKENDQLRQRVALALSEILVVSDKSSIGGNIYALADYYDILLRNAFGNYRQLMDEVTYHSSMGVYLTYMGNPKTDVAENRFPDENYARELMQLFTIGLYELNNDGTHMLDGNGQSIPTYDNNDIAEYSKIFTGLTWGDGMYFFGGSPTDTSYLVDMRMAEEWHEPGPKYLLKNDTISDRIPIDGKADVKDALDNLFNHPNVGPFVSRLLIQRLVTSNPSAEYIDRVASVFNDNGEGERGDLSAVIKAIFLDPIANDCASGDDPNFGKLREPFIRYLQIHKAFNAASDNGNVRNALYLANMRLSQNPLTSPSVFNFFQPDYQPIGPVEQAGLVAPEFQITDAQSISSYLNGLYDWVINGNISDEWELYTNEADSTFQNEIARLTLTEELLNVEDDRLHILIDRLNLLLAHGRLSLNTMEIIKNTVIQFDNESDEDKERRVRLSIYLVMSTPEYLINR